ncbi:LytR/AlgR family response regulator transcription factor [Colwelliaceae bacterium 6441]
MTLLTKFKKWPHRYELLFISCYLFINNTISATSILMEANRDEAGISFPIWQPFLWEYSSALSLIFFLPLLILFLAKKPLAWENIKQNFLWHVLFSILFSMLHISLMVLIRKLVYMSQDLHYEFGELPLELFYEYRKDAWAYCLFVVIIYCFRFVTSRLIGEAKPIDFGEKQQKPPPLERLLVKKLGKEFIINIADIEWFESSGNYVNLHIKDRIYPIRSTLSSFVEQVSTQGFSRIHRSYGVNLNEVEMITPLPSGDCELQLKNNKVLSLSRRYRDDFKAMLGL